MINFKKVFIYILISILSLLLIILLVEIRTSIALNDYSMLPHGVKIVDKVVLGRRNRTLSEGLGKAYYLEFRHGIDKAFRRGAIELVCTNGGNILLVMKDYKKYIEEADEAFLFISFRVENSIFKGEVKINRIEFLSREYFDTFVSIPLSETENVSVLKALKQRKSSNIGLSTFDGGNAFIGNAKVSDVEMLINKCQKIK